MTTMFPDATLKTDKDFNRLRRNSTATNQTRENTTVDKISLMPLSTTNQRKQSQGTTPKHVWQMSAIKKEL